MYLLQGSSGHCHWHGLFSRVLVDTEVTILFLSHIEYSFMKRKNDMGTVLHLVSPGKKSLSSLGIIHNKTSGLTKGVSEGKT